MSRLNKTWLILAVLILGGLLQSCGKSETDKEKPAQPEPSQVERSEPGISIEELARESEWPTSEQPGEQAPSAEQEQADATGKPVPAEQPASPAPVGQLVLVRGKVYVKRHEEEESLLANVGFKVYLNDRIITSKNGYARMRMRDDSMLRIAPTSELAVTTQLIGPEHNNTTIDLLKGKLRAIVVHKLSAGDSYEVKTDVAVAGVRGTDFEVIAGRGTVVRCYTGVVAITNLDTSVAGQVTLTPRTYTVVTQQRPPIMPKVLPANIVPMQDPPPSKPLDSGRASGKKPPAKLAELSKPPVVKPKPPVSRPKADTQASAQAEREPAASSQAPEEQLISQEQAISLMEQSFQVSLQNLRDSNVKRLWEQDTDKPLHEMLYGDGLEGWTVHPAK